MMAIFAPIIPVFHYSFPSYPFVDSLGQLAFSIATDDIHLQFVSDLTTSISASWAAYLPK